MNWWDRELEQLEEYFENGIITRREFFKYQREICEEVKETEGLEEF